ncbi:M4 family metallopeptidase [Massilia solisilvae]|uniref:M4 family metallopeptidase n=1 Tax=Massilia solisilvae TaxID=1811225 RepID=A0ABT2BQP9_9BURK|nr:M4 family metallopeptidase [Massilia solisilvae]MCS0610188.1 M4 family metallopeptidase [Massilia solisilvae]
MNLNKRLLAASMAAVPLLLGTTVEAASPAPSGPGMSMRMSGPVAPNPQQVVLLQGKLLDTRVKYGLDQDHGFLLAAQHPGTDGTYVSRFAHTYKGVRVYQSESVVVSDAVGNIVSESAADRRAGLGRGASAASLGQRFANFDVTPALTPQAAIEQLVRTGAPGASHVSPPTAELVIYPVLKRVRIPSAFHKRESQLNATDLVTQVAGYELAYLVRTRMINADRPLHRDAIVSAVDGRVLQQWNALQTETGVGRSQYNGQVPVSTSSSGGSFVMKDPLRGTGGRYGANTITNADHGSTAGEVYTNGTNAWGDGQQYVAGGSTTNANGQTAAVNALWGMMNTYDTLKNVLGWHSLDGNNTATYIAAHVYNNYDNAYYSDSCKCMFIGDGGTYFYSLGSVDVIGHEMGHGVTAATSNLAYYGESGGLNESASDINGEMTEAYARGGGTGSTVPSGNDWLIGMEISRSSDPLRWMYKPSKDGSSPDAWSSSIGGLDVHYSSGPNNRMFYFLSQGSKADSGSDYYSPYLTKSPRAMTGIGNDKAYRIWFRALTTKFTSSTDYADARAKVIQAAQELYGAGSREVIAVQRAYAAINVGADVDENSTGGPVVIGTQPQSVTVAPGATATFSVGVSGGTQPYKYQWMRNGANIAGASAASYSLRATPGDNGARFSVKVTDSASPATSATSSAATLTVATSAPVERVTNGSFESQATGWSGTTGVIGTWVGYNSEVPYDGRYFAYLGGNGRTATEMLSQTVAIPSVAQSATLTYALHIDTNEFSSSIAYDKLVVTLKNPAGAVLATLATYSNLDKAAGYQVRSFDLTPYKGQNVTISFEMNEDYSLQTSFTLDKVSVVTQ